MMAGREKGEGKSRFLASLGMTTRRARARARARAKAKQEQRQKQIPFGNDNQ
jgi:hypothetical protein